ncbi:MAG TPA: PfkB family carbohydrate kinase [Jatrophihabitantaceae bacterium]|nr:PfkB family carbohydrate kinase [Jatrophihabitantaceae bacterium]
MLAVVGNLSIDRVDGSPPRIGGGPYHAARALRLLGARGEVIARCADAERRFLLPRLAAVGVPVRLLHGTRTTAFTFAYDGENRTMSIDAIGDAWTPGDARAVDRRVRWLHVAPLVRSDFPAETLAELGRGRRLLLDGQGLVRRPQLGPLELDGDFDPTLLRHVTILKLAEDEAAIVGDVDVPERIVTLGSRGAVVYAKGRETHVRARPLARDPTGAGDAFAAAYLVSRASGHAPAAAARRATSVVGAAL